MIYNFIHSFHPQPILFQFGPIKIHWYGLLMTLSIFAGIFFVKFFAKKYGIKKDDVYDLAFSVVIFGLLGARIYAVLLFPAHYFSNPLEIVQVWKGGLAIHGALLGGALALFLHCRKRKQNFWLWADLIVPALALGQAIGRWGNYFNQELYGRPTDLPWGIPIDPLNRASGFENFEFFHPTFLYESILNFIVFLILVGLHIYRRKKVTSYQLPVTSFSEKKLTTYNLKLTTGSIALHYLMFYSLIRIFMEQFRIDETPIFFGTRLPILVSLVIFASAVSLLLRNRISRHPRRMTG